MCSAPLTIVRSLSISNGAPVQSGPQLAVEDTARALQADRERRQGQHRGASTSSAPAEARMSITRRSTGGLQRVPSAASHAALVPWRSQSHSPAAQEAVVST